MTEQQRESIVRALDAVRAQAPVVHAVVGAPVAPLVADLLLAAGARPLMTWTEHEAPVLVGGADALLVNVGSLGTDAAAAIVPTVAAARAAGLPWVLDPAAIGAAPVRTTLARSLLLERPAVVRGNASEVLALLGGRGGRGADTTVASTRVLAEARAVAEVARAVVAVSGATDVVVDPDRPAGEAPLLIDSGTPVLARVTGTGCALGALVAACTSVADPVTGALVATAWLTVAGERAASASRGVGSFRVALLDEIDLVAAQDVAESVRLR